MRVETVKRHIRDIRAHLDVLERHTEERPLEVERVYDTDCSREKRVFEGMLQELNWLLSDLR